MDIEMKVTQGGFEPSEVRVRVGEEVRLRVKRTARATCATSIESPGILDKTDLPLGELVEIVFMPSEAGIYRFGCAMEMHIGGALIVEA